MNPEKEKKSSNNYHNDDFKKEDVQKDVQNQIQEMKTYFKENPKKQLEEGTWFTTVLHKVLGDSRNLSADYFKKKYVGLDKDNIAKRLIKNASYRAAIAGGLAGAAVTGLELSTLITGGASLLAVGASVISEIATITYIQLKLVYEISVLYNAKLDPEDPEDLMTVFWYTLGINKWEEVGNAVLAAGPRTAEYLGRKALRNFNITKLFQNSASKFGGVQLARKITEKGLLKLLVPGVNIAAAFTINKIFTDKLGAQAIKTFNNRSLATNSLDQLMQYDRSYQLITVPLIYHVGINESKKVGKVIEMQNTALKYLKTNEQEDKTINELITIDIEEFCELLSGIKNEKVRHYIGNIAVLSHALSGNINELSLNPILRSMGIEFSNEYKQKLKKNIK